ncbi:MAG: hypothetical protein IT480_13930 [Gammaproteobacteria bacterium]|nr:hypothetical protein [Gammaproteobacteria bacterium]
MQFKAGVYGLLLATCIGTHGAEVPGGWQAGSARTGIGPIRTDRYQATYVRLDARQAEGLLYEPVKPGANYRVALVYTFPRATFDAAAPVEMASRGYRALLVTPYAENTSPLDGLAETSAGVAYLRSLPGVERVVIMGHSGGGQLMALYANLALNGPAACQNPEMIYPCRSEDVSGLARPDGLVLLDPSPGTINPASAVDPAYDADNRRSRADLDMYNPANGYDPETGSAAYPAGFRRKYYAAQSRRNMQLIDHALARLKLIEQGKGAFQGDEPLVAVGTVNGGNAARLYHTDLSLQSRTRQPHLLLRADGSTSQQVITSVRAPSGTRDINNIGKLSYGAINTTVRGYLANYALRTTRDFAITADDIIGVDWKSGMRSTPYNATGITVPTLVLVMSCYYFVTSSEIIYDHLAAPDRTYAAVEGALHGFTPCRPEYGDTLKRTFDFVDDWLSRPGRF